MSFPFQKPDIKRSFQCFVCGRKFTDYQEYTTHITQTHEEGREFVICPLSRCKAPVRDIRLHFLSKHKGETIPKSGQMKATVWKDINPKTGKISQRKPKFREGFFVSHKNSKEMHYRSGYECEVYECLEVLTEVIKYDVEPFKVDYIFEGERHEYNPDLSIFFNDGRVEIWEIKPANQTHLQKNQAKWTACQQYCQARGWSFMVMTEVGIGKLKNAVKQQMRQ